MLLVMPKKHLSQVETWRSNLIGRLSRVAVDMGCIYAPKGFRVLSNFGSDALQTQDHGHLHVVGGTSLGHYA
jgi:diadenosine tetraphosphate (Ap4A) HIT family hydrolase